MRSSHISRLFSYLTIKLQARHKLVIAFSLVIILLSAYKFYNLKPDTSISTLIPDNSPELVEAARLLDLNPISRLLFVELSSESPADTEAMEAMAVKLKAALSDYCIESDFKKIPAPESLLNLLPAVFDEEMSAKIEQKSSKQAIESSIPAMRKALAGNYGFAPKEFMRTDPLNFLGALKDRFPLELLQMGGSNKGFAAGEGFSVSDNGKRVLLILRPKANMNNTIAAKELILTLQSELKKILAESHAEIKTLVVGGTRFTAENTIAIENDLKLTVSLSLLFIGLIYLFCVRSLGAIWLFITPIVAVVVSGAALSTIWPQTAGLALGFGAAVLGIAEDYAVIVHFGLRRNPGNKAKAIGLLARPVVFSAALCMSSFCVLMFSGIPALRQLGFFAAFSLFIGLLIATIVLPFCPKMDSPVIKSKDKAKGAGLENLNPKLALTAIIWCILVATCILGASSIPFDTSVQNLSANNAALQKDMNTLRSHWQGGNPPEMWASSGQSLDEALNNAAALKRSIKVATPNAHFFSLSDLVPTEKEQKANWARWQKFITENRVRITQQVQEVASRHGFKDIALAPFLNWMKAEQKNGQISDSLTLLKNAGLDDILWWLLVERNNKFYVLSLGDAKAASSPLSPEIVKNTSLLSPSVIAKSMNTAFNQERHLFPLACIICLALLFVCFRRRVLVMLSCLPPLFGLSVIVVWLHLSGQSLTLAGAAALILVVGLGADYGIVMLHELASNRSIGAYRSILVSGLTTLSGIGVLILAKHPVLHELGTITFLGLGAEMLAVLIFVPLLCSGSKEKI